jgi:hypothetical protein
MVPSVEPPSDVLALSDERDMHERLRAAAWRDGFLAGREAAWAQGYMQAESGMATQWRPFAREVAERATETDQARASRAVAAAESYTGRAAGEHWRTFVARAFAERPDTRSLPQQVTVEEIRRARGWAT